MHKKYGINISLCVCIRNVGQVVCVCVDLCVHMFVRVCVCVSMHLYVYGSLHLCICGFVCSCVHKLHMQWMSDQFITRETRIESLTPEWIIE